jgi:hypothetical protein
LHRPVDVFADCTVDTPAGRIGITGTGQTVVVSAARPGTYRQLLCTAPFGRAQRSGPIRLLRDSLGHADLELSLHVKNVEIGRMSPGMKDGLLSALFGLPGIQIRPVGLLRSFLVYTRPGRELA